MEAQNEPGRIRPLPPEIPERAAWGDAPPPPPDRRWVPIVVAGGALVFFGLLAGLFGGETETAQTAGASPASDTTVPPLGGDPPPTTTTTTAPPTLEQMASVLSRPLAIVYRDHGDATTSRATWNLDELAPTEVGTTGAAAEHVASDASHQQILWITRGQADTLWVGQPPLAEPVFVDVAGAHWHPTTPLALAWIGTLPGSEAPHLFRAGALPTAGLDGLVDIGPLPVGSELLGWGEWGFAVRVPVPIASRQWEVPDPANSGTTTFQLLEFTLLLDPLGAATTAIPGTPHAVGSNGELVIQPANEAFAAAVAAGFDLTTVGVAIPITPLDRGQRGEPIVVLGPNLATTPLGIQPAARVTTYVFSPDASHIATMGELEGRFAITTEALDGSSRRITSVADVNTAIGFSRDGSLLILHNRDNGDLVFHDWNRGASYRIPFDGGRILAVDG